MLSTCRSGQTPSVPPARLGITDEAPIVANMPLLTSVDGFTASHTGDNAVSDCYCLKAIRDVDRSYERT